MPIRHLVMWKLWDTADGPRFKAELDSCIDLVPGMDAFNVVLRQNALDAYQAHPHHKAVSSRIGALRETRHVLDYEIPS
jgi:hypothetical protein